LDWEWRTNQDMFSGEVAGTSCWVGVEDGQRTEVVADEEGEWIEGDSDRKLVEAEGMKEDGEWRAHHLWI
jgi:hypothetical protein